jgi:hypothetical protein
MTRRTCVTSMPSAFGDLGHRRRPLLVQQPLPMVCQSERPHQRGVLRGRREPSLRVASDRNSCGASNGVMTCFFSPASPASRARRFPVARRLPGSAVDG